jgi:hypothetical protein
MYKVYGGAGKVATGWVSNTQFEPHVADSILKSMCRAIPSLDVRHGLQFVRAITNGHLIEGAVFIDLHTGKQVEVIALQTIDATELGDVMASAGVPFDLGMEASSQTGENLDIPESNPIIQDLTYAAILKDYGPTADCTLIKPNGYDPREFDCCCTDNCSDSMKLFSKVNRQTMLNYGRLPNGKYLLNWPSHGNDMYLDIVSMDENARAIALQGAKQKTLRFIYHIQTALGFKNLGLADDEFPTGDRLPLIPYHREGRRLKGIVRFKVQHIARPFEDSFALYRTGISVGDYPIDQHHRENPAAPQHLGYYPVPSFNIPLGALIPARHDGLIVAEKGISVSNAANGTTRLQPVVMLTGQAAGALAALAVIQKNHARNVAVRTVQAALLESGAYLMPFFDVSPAHSAFRAIQKMGATGILKGKGEPFQWENRTWFFPDSPVYRRELTIDIAPFIKLDGTGTGQMTIGDAIQLADQLGSLYQAGFQHPGKQHQSRDA